MAAREKDINKQRTMAERADKHELYEQAVQNVEGEVEFFLDTFKAITGRRAYVFREDFCGTASAACEWVKQGDKFRATGVDLCAETLQWGREHRVSELSAEQQSQLTLVEGNVLDARSEPADILGASNFSYWCFHTRAELLAYFRAAYQNIKDDGLFFLDIYGGSEAFEELKEKTKHDEFTYVWHQKHYYPVTGEYVCHIHFHFPDKSKMKKAFTYHWRLWTLPEVRELLTEAGFSKSTVYWEGDDDDGGGNGIFEPEERGEADAGWIAYVVAEK
jgi:SAM-dependent methyltransferase